MRKEYMIDCETLSMNKRAVVWQFAIREIGGPMRKSVIMCPREQYRLSIKGNFETSEETIEWAQETYGEESVFENWYALFKQDKVHHGAWTIAHLQKWLKEICDPDGIFWAKGADFDFPIMENQFAALALAPPWFYRYKSCLRTLINENDRLNGFDKNVRTIMYQNYNPHDALSDCATQVKQLEYLRRNMNLKLNAAQISAQDGESLKAEEYDAQISGEHTWKHPGSFTHVKLE